MAQAYSDPRRASDPFALPNIEVFYASAAAIRRFDWRDDDGNLMGAGWYWQSCFPGCLPDGEAMGPFDSEAAALADAQEGYDDETDSDSEDDDA